MTAKKNSSLQIEIANSELLKPRIVIFGVGGAGGNAINNMIRSNLEGVEFVAANTDSQSLKLSLAENKIQLGAKVTKGLGAGSFPDRGNAAAQENIDEISDILEGANMVFIAAGMGGGTGTGAAPVIAKLAKERDILTVGVVTKPFHFEGKYRMEIANEGVEELKRHVDTLIVIPNQNLFRIANEQTTFESAFKMADDVLYAGVRGVTDLITRPGLVNLDFADIRTIMTQMGKAMMGTGEAEGENRALMACEAAISNPLLDDISIKGAKGVLVNMTGGPDMTLFEADVAVNAIKKEVDENANIIFGSAFDENMKGKIRVSVVATGIEIEDFANLQKENKAQMQNFAAKNSSQNFFDPGLPKQVEKQEVEEIIDVNFSTKRKFSKEENLNYGNLPVQENQAAEIQETFFAKVEIQENPKLEEKTEVKKKAKPAKIKKEKSGGFSLFSFMNSGSEVEKEENENFEIQEENFQENEDSLLQDFPSKQEIKEVKSKEKEAAKKRQEFFSETIFDEEEDASREVKFDDDILNVPAFFRRKDK
jgi:cell division protein FtsZ